MVGDDHHSVTRLSVVLKTIDADAVEFAEQPAQQRLDDLHDFDSIRKFSIAPGERFEEKQRFTGFVGIAVPSWALSARTVQRPKIVEADWSRVLLYAFVFLLRQ
jgi:hypothetical protein